MSVEITIEDVSDTISRTIATITITKYGEFFVDIASGLFRARYKEV